MADLNIPNLNMKSDKYIFKKKLSLRRKSRRRLFSESVFLFIISLLLVYINFLIPNKLNESIGMGMYGYIENSYNGHDFINYIKKQMDIKHIRHSKILNKRIKKVAVLGGSGSFGINNAIEKKIDCYITSDLKYHDFFKANNKILLLDIGHYESEKFTKELIYNYLLKKIPKFACIIANTNTNPVNYY